MILTDVSAMLRAVLIDPFDDVARLAYADALAAGTAHEGG